MPRISCATLLLHSLSTRREDPSYNNLLKSFSKSNTLLLIRLQSFWHLFMSFLTLMGLKRSWSARMVLAEKLNLNYEDAEEGF
nr:hypothetical protein [Tanacetum cinerariifolium]